jgi:hypothetical protein
MGDQIGRPFLFHSFCFAFAIGRQLLVVACCQMYNVVYPF